MEATVGEIKVAVVAHAKVAARAAASKITRGRSTYTITRIGKA